MNRILVLVLVLILPLFSSAKKEDLKLRLIKNARHIYSISQENQAIENGKISEVEQRINLKIEHRIVDILPNGNYSVEISLKRFSIQMKHNTKVLRYDSDTVDVSNPLYKTLNFLTDVRLNYEVTPEGEVRNLKGFDPIRNEIEKDMRLANLLRNFGSEIFYTELYNYISRSEVEVGETWKKNSVLPDLNDLKCDVHYTLKEVSPQSLKIAQESSFQMVSDLPKAPDGTVSKVKETGTLKGTLVIDPKTNMRISSSLTQSANITMLKENSTPDKEKAKTLKLVTKTTFTQEKK